MLKKARKEKKREESRVLLWKAPAYMVLNDLLNSRHDILKNVDIKIENAESAI